MCKLKIIYFRNVTSIFPKIEPIIAHLQLLETNNFSEFS